MEASRILETASGPAVLSDSCGRIVGWNGQARDFFGYGDGFAVSGRKIESLLQLRDAFGRLVREDRFPFYELACQGEPIKSLEMTALTGSGGTRPVTASVVVVLGPFEADCHFLYLLRPRMRRRRSDEAIELILANGALPVDKLGRADETKESKEEAKEEAPSLSPRQVEILRLVTEGLTNREIADVLELSVNTVRSHVQSILEKLQVRNKLQAAILAVREDLI